MASESRLKANKKYHEKFGNIQIRVPSGGKDAIIKHAESRGETLNGFVRRTINEAMERDKTKADEK